MTNCGDHGELKQVGLDKCATGCWCDRRLQLSGKNTEYRVNRVCCLASKVGSVLKRV